MEQSELLNSLRLNGSDAVVISETSIQLSVVVPVYNEESSIDPFLERINQVFDKLPHVHVEFLFIDDGSTDRTLNILLQYQQARDSRIVVIELSRNFGKEAALSAGLQVANGQIIVPIDIDLQDPPELIPEMITKWQEGYEVVLARRIDRNSDTLSKRITASMFYRLHNMIADPQIPENVGDFRLMDRSVVEALKELPESRRFMKGLFAWLGFRTTYVDYVRPARVAGSSKFNGWRLWNFAIEGITSFSTAPLRIWTYFGFAVSFLSFIFALFIALMAVFHGRDVPGYASLMVAVTFLGGLQLIGIGVIGEYLGRTYLESKRRPVYLVRHIHKPRI